MQNAALVLYPISESQLPEVLAHFKTAAQRIATLQVDHWQYWHAPPQEKIDWIKAGLKAGEFYFIYAQNTCIGLVRILKEDLLYWGHQSEKALYIHSLLVFPQYNGKGYGASAITHIEARAQAENCAFLRLDCVKSNSILCRFYESLGFVKVGEKAMPLSLNNLYQKSI